MSNLSINGQSRAVKSPEDTPLLWVLRDELGMTGTKFGCGMGLCGACTVMIDGQAVRSCQTPISAVGTSKITTVEGLGELPVGRAVQKAWVDLDVVQCGYCQPGQCMAATALLTAKRTPTAAEVDEGMNQNICRCGTYQRIRRAVQVAAQELAKG